jgi:hypothetical protein
MITDPDEKDSKFPFFLIPSIHGELFKVVSPSPKFDLEGDRSPRPKR